MMRDVADNAQEEAHDDSEGAARRAAHTFLLLCVSVVVILLLSAAAIIWLVPTWPDRGDFGGLFGGVNTLFSGLAFAGVVYAILLQQQELRLQRRELRLTTIELKRTASAQERSEQALHQQVELQNRLVSAQLLRDRFDMYWKTYEPLTDEEVRTFLKVPDDLMPYARYLTLKDDVEALHRYVTLARTYEYLAFTHAVRNVGVRDPLGVQWLDLWTRDLTRHDYFMEVNAYYRPYYPAFAEYVDALYEDG